MGDDQITLGIADTLIENIMPAAEMIKLIGND